MAAITSKERGPKRSIRRNGSARYPPAAGLSSSSSQSPSKGRASKRKNKYLLLEETYYEERRLRVLEEEGLSGRGGASGPRWMRAAASGSGAVGAGGISPATLKKAESRLRMTRVDGFNSTAVGLSPRNNKVLCLGSDNLGILLL